MEIRYQFDEAIPKAIVNGLRQRGVDVMTAAEADLLEASDEEHLAFAKSEARVMFCCDDDFLRLSVEETEHAGIIYCHQRDRTIGQMVLGLVALWRNQTAEEIKGQVHFL